MKNELSLVLVGSAGQGVQTIEEMLVSIFKNFGLNVFATKEYMSRVRGGMNSTEFRISDTRVCSYISRIDLLVPLEKGAISHVLHRIDERSIILFDQDLVGELNENERDKIPKSKLISITISKIAKDIGKKLFTNIVAVGLIAGILNVGSEFASTNIVERFEKKGQDIIEKNQEALKKGFELGRNIASDITLDFEFSLNSKVADEILINGNQAMGLGAIAGGCNFIASYPMSPSTGMLVFLAQNARKFDIVVDQVESEIAAINKVVGASYAGARSVATTSGGGFALMEEGISLAAMTETPIVVHVAQRPGPATGLPTRTAQEDLNLVLNSGHGEFVRVIYAPGTIEQAFYTTAEAFNVADKYQIPVFVLTDQYFVDSYYNIPQLDVQKVKNKKHIIKTEEGYKRYAFTDDGISPRGVPGFGDGLVRADSDEHDEWGHITEDMLEIRPKMVEKRYHKRIELLKKNAQMPTVIGSKKSKKMIICWGSSYQVVKEALEKLNLIDEKEVAMVHFNQVFPIHPQVSSLLKSSNYLYSIEGNASGQFAGVLMLHAGVIIPVQNQFLKYSGVPFSVEETMEFIEKTVLNGGNE